MVAAAADSAPRPALQDAGWVRTPIDAFILATLEAKGLRPAPPADRRTLIRRAHLRPARPAADAGRRSTPSSRDDSPDAYERLVDRLLASPRYGERWGRHWLDVVHYGDTHGYDKDKRRDHAWPYRDYVIRAFNDDKPYARFVAEQLAGDVLFPGDPDGIIATGLHRRRAVGLRRPRRAARGHGRQGQDPRCSTATTWWPTPMSTFLSLTVHCARCHDHKFDPIPQEDYYRLQAVFAGVDRGDRPYRPDRLGARRPSQVVRRRRCRGAEPAAEFTVLLTAATSDAARMHAVRRRRGDHCCRVRVDAELARSDFRAWPISRADEGAAAGAALADWIADPQNAAHLAVDRQPRLALSLRPRASSTRPTTSAATGSQPTHPELLDWLAVEFRDGGQSLKALHRLIVHERRLPAGVARRPADGAAIDADNRYLWRMNRQRLDAESSATPCWPSAASST